MVSAVDAFDGKVEDPIENAANDHPTKDVKLKDVPFELEDGGQATIDELMEINLGSEDDPKPTFLSAQSILEVYIDCFAWSYKEMLGLDMEVATHKLATDPSFLS